MGFMDTLGRQVPVRGAGTGYGTRSVGCRACQEGQGGTGHLALYSIMPRLSQHALNGTPHMAMLAGCHTGTCKAKWPYQ